MLETLTFTTVVAGLVFNVLNFLYIRKSKSMGCDKACTCRYPDTNIRDILIDHELEKARELDSAIKKIEAQTTKDK